MRNFADGPRWTMWNLQNNLKFSFETSECSLKIPFSVAFHGRLALACVLYLFRWCYYLASENWNTSVQFCRVQKKKKKEDPQAKTPAPTPPISFRNIRDSIFLLYYDTLPIHGHYFSRESWCDITPAAFSCSWGGRFRILSLAAHPCRRQQFGFGVLDQRANVGRPAGTQKHRCPMIHTHRSKLPSVL